MTTPIYIPRQTATDYPVYPKRGRQVYGFEKTAEVLEELRSRGGPE
jgi:hypothetical protein